MFSGNIVLTFVKNVDIEGFSGDRKGQQLAYEDTQHYQRIVVALNETIRNMARNNQSPKPPGEQGPK